jgi:hypothetical protein
MTDTKVFRAPMRSRRDDVDPAATIARARRLGLVGFGETGSDERSVRRVERFRDVPDDSFVWTRDTDGLYWLGRIGGDYRCDRSAEAVAVDLVHVRPCEWLPAPLTEPSVPAAVIATFGRGGRNFQQTHDSAVGRLTAQIWASGA